MSAVVWGLLWLVVPPEQPVDPQGSIDWIGAALGTAGLIIFNAAWKYASRMAILLKARLML